VAAAIIMPYDAFARAVEERAYDIEAIARLFGTSFEQTAHRLPRCTSRARKRCPSSSCGWMRRATFPSGWTARVFPLRATAGLPLWNVHEVFAAPGRIATQWLELPDGQRFFSIARTVGGWGLGAATRAARGGAGLRGGTRARLVYAQGLDPRRAEATPIGVSCRLCHRPACAARAAPIGREVMADDVRRGVAPFGLAES
jgi:predicted transcriptional regulator